MVGSHGKVRGVMKQRPRDGCRWMKMDAETCGDAQSKAKWVHNCDVAFEGMKESRPRQKERTDIPETECQDKELCKQGVPGRSIDLQRGPCNKMLYCDYLPAVFGPH